MTIVKNYKEVFPPYLVTGTSEAWTKTLSAFDGINDRGNFLIQRFLRLT